MPLTLEDIYDEASDLETSEDRIQYLIELGAAFDPLAKGECTEDNRVLGCQSMVWLTHRLSDGKLYFSAFSDAPMVQGLASVVVTAYSGKTAREVLSFDVNDIFGALHLKSFLSPLRSNGVHSMIQKITDIASAEIVFEHHTENVIEVQNDVAKSLPVRRSIEVCRNDFAILKSRTVNDHPLVYFDSAASSQRPDVVIEAIVNTYRSHYSNVHRSGHTLANETTSAMEASRESIRRFINAQHNEEVIFTSGTTFSINAVAQSWGNANVQPGDNIVLSEMEHHSNIVPWQQLAERTGAEVRWIPITDKFTLDLDKGEKLIDRRTKIVSITAVSNVLGTINPVAKIAAMAHAKGAVILVDAAQAIPHGGVDVQAWDADFVAFSGHKMLGPNGIGVLYGKRTFLEAMPPFLGGGNMIKSVELGGFTAAPIPHRFEAGTASIVEAIAMKPAIDYLESIGSESILRHERELYAHAMRGLSDISGLNAIGPSMELKTGILSFTIEGIDNQTVAYLLDEEGIAVRVGHHCAMPLHHRLGLASTCRASFYFYNTINEVERFTEVVHRIRKRF